PVVGELGILAAPARFVPDVPPTNAVVIAQLVDSVPDERIGSSALGDEAIDLWRRRRCPPVVGRTPRSDGVVRGARARLGGSWQGRRLDRAVVPASRHPEDPRRARVDPPGGCGMAEDG